VVYTDPARDGQTERIRYDYLINATGPKLNFEATPGLGPDGHTVSVCTPSHAAEAAQHFDTVIDKLKAGQKQTLVIGVGHGTCTCEGAAFEYAFNVEQELRAAGVRDRAEVIYLTNEHELGDFGVGGMTFSQNKQRITSESWMGSLFRERDMKAITQAAVTKIDPSLIHYTQIDGTENTQQFDFAMLLPPFRGVGLQAFDRNGEDITDVVFAPSGFMRVDANYTASMSEMSAACIASTGTGLLTGTAAAMTMSPIVPDFSRHPTTAGRHPTETTGDLGLAAHWVKRVLHTMFIYKAKAYPFWYLIPE